jgi:hypothetical protein
LGQCSAIVHRAGVTTDCPDRTAFPVPVPAIGPTYERSQRQDGIPHIARHKLSTVTRKPVSKTAIPRAEQVLVEAGVGALRAGNFEAALRLFRNGQRRYPRWPSFSYNIACCHAVRGDVDAAIDALGRALENGYRSYRNLDTDADLRSLRSNEGFKRLHARWVPRSKHADIRILYRGVTVARGLVNDIEDAQRHRSYTIGKRTYKRIRFGSEKDDWGSSKKGSCGDCAVFVGQFHQLGCDVERCPKCHRQALACPHLDEELYSD